MVNWIVDHILHAQAWLVYVIVGLLVFAEDALFLGFVIPGETAAIVGGVTARVGHTQLWVVIVVVVLAAVVGDTVGYEVGRALGPRLLTSPRFEGRREKVDAAQDFLRRRGGSAIFLGRWVAFFRAVMPALAGASRMRYVTFLAWNASGGILWGTAMVVAGYVAGASYQRLESWLGTGTAVVAVLIVVAALTVWQLRRHRRAHDRHDAHEVAERDASPDRE